MFNPSNKSAGFTLMEVLAAMTLLALVLPAAMKGVSIAVTLASDSIGKITAAELAENRLAEALLLEEWKNGSGRGDFGDDYPNYRWTLETSDWSQTGLKQIDLSVTWMQRGYEKEFSLSTLIYEAQE
jgi:general secretion pathway protein I